VSELRLQYEQENPLAVKLLEDIDKQIAPARIAKYYYLSKTPNKKLGFVYYVRYLEGGKLVPSRWTTRTNNLDLAQKFAENNRASILAGYHAHRDAKLNFEARITGYYEKGSEALKVDADRGRNVSEHNRGQHLLAAKGEFMPFLKKQGIKDFPDVTPAVITKFQNSLLARGVSPQTVNKKIGSLSAMFKQFTMLGVTKHNPFKDIARIPSSEQPRGCHDLESIPGVFEEPWSSQDELIACLLSYAAGLRNIEIERATVGDVFRRDGMTFLNVPESKTKNGVRIVPLHPFLLAKLDLDRPPDAPLVEFAMNSRLTYRKANATLGQKMGMLPEQLAKESITFYSGRHFYKTMLNAGGLGDAEEYFMGHRVSSDVSKVYNHRDRQGQKKVAEAAAKAIAIMDEFLFVF
jgi:integrase